MGPRPTRFTYKNGVGRTQACDQLPPEEFIAQSLSVDACSC